MMIKILTAIACCLVFSQLQAGAANLEPPEMTSVTGRLMKDKDTGAGAGSAYFIFQRRMLEIPHENSLEALHAMAETVTAVDSDGSFTLRMAPGNYLLLFEPN